MKALAAAIVLSALLVGCGVPLQHEPAPIEPAPVPSRLTGSAEPTTGQPTATRGKPTVQVNFVRKDKLVSLVREAPDAAVTDRLTTVIQALLAGPTAAEQSTGLTSALPPDLALSIVQVEGNRVVLELSGETDGRSATENILAVGQIVLSMTAVPTIDEVTFSRDGQPVEALLADGALTAEPLTAADYAQLKSR
ncbi:sporulation and spore germination protein [Kribbella voronezhensis]|uniref:Sporulation and spore germination protein n=1 Tax=Kribbella voronezhensis TaxID=2512212 RepID=A0A4R7SVR6_9ACTN|nr:GerMN domain-containing protein [Kribbella voronezhensis]TDU83271.1 sporulation and spore germination protein [Kribbella voronezhensis]